MTRKYNQGVADSNSRRAKHGATARKRGVSVHHKGYTTWQSIKQRCLNPNTTHYHRYGGRGITMHPEWVEDFVKFLSDVGEPAERGMTLDRIDNDGNYEPGNVRWVGRKEQANNRSSNVVVEYDGKSMNLKQWAEHLGWKYGLIASRWKLGTRGAELFAPPKHERNKGVTHNGETRTLREWSDISGVPYVTLYWRHKHGKDIL